MDRAHAPISKQTSDAAPPLRFLIREARWVPELLLSHFVSTVAERPKVSNGAPVLTLPGLCGGDDTMKLMRLRLNAAGFAAKRWKLGRNYGARTDILPKIDARVRHIFDATGQPVHLVGWSLGGILARTYAQYHPEMIASVITMGSPFAGSLKTNHAWRVYELVAKHKVDAPPIPINNGQKLSMPSYTLWSSRDGIVSHYGSRGEMDQSDAIYEVSCGHFGFGYDERVIDVVIECLVDAQNRATSLRDIMP